jgi:hypothetical protein
MTGCAYNGTLKSGFYTPPAASGTKLPLKADLVCGDFFKSTVIDPGHIYGDYSAHIKINPALQDAITRSCEMLFEEVYVSEVTDLNNARGADIVILPKIEFDEHHLTLTLTVKNAYSGESIQEYSASDNLQSHAPGGVHALDTFDIFACGLLAPVIIPSNTSMIGHRAEDDLGKSLSFCLGQIVENISNDPALVSKAKASGKTIPKTP